ncbi:hypothetical protein H072_1574 [Dactylellina haptotyla CBS 200.50]|uniref:Transcription factor IIIC putative zinc-finger domain-containing protein n=1 Tax=Dactylellina haptotyla (strain CBS 200.50) TaxID=1284197 RepID=S8C9W9_DACHA|nr:hypothetical protein H072_1574 [Dactylellina haptotyla CBS 200.50]
MLLKNIDLNFYPSLPLNYKFSADGQLCIPAGQITYIVSNSVLNPDLVSNPPVPSKFRPGDENKVDYRNSENRADWKGYGAGGESGDDDDNAEGGSDNSDDEGSPGEEVEGDVEEDKARPEFQFHWQKLELIEDDKEDDVMKGGVTFQLDQTFKEGYARQLEWSPLGVGKYRRCCLAILTTARQILIYQPATVIGRGLRLSMKLLDRLIDQDVPGEEAVEITWDKLPREICWSHPCSFHTQRWGIPIFTMVNEFNELRFVKIINNDVETLLETTLNLPDDARILNMCWSPWFIISPTEAIAFFCFKSGCSIYLQKMIMSKNENKISLVCEGDPTAISNGMLPGYEPHAVIWYDRSYTLPSQAPEMLLAVIQHDGADLFGISLDQKKAVTVPRRAKIELHLPARLAGYTFSDPLWANYLDLNIACTNGALAIFKIDLADLAKSIIYKAVVPHFRGRTMIQNDPAIAHPNPWKRDFIDILDEKREAFIEEWKIMQASCQVYGMAYSALGGILTVCYRLKPEGVLEYPIKERERCTLSWELCRTWTDMFDSSKAEGSAKPFTLFGVSGEAFISDIRFIVDPDEAEESFGKMEDVIAKGMEESEKRLLASSTDGVAVVVKQEAEQHKLAGLASSDLADHLSLNLFNSTEAILLRARNLLGLLRANKIAPKKPGVLTAQMGITKLALRSLLEIPINKESSLFKTSKNSVLAAYLLACLGIIAFYRDERILELSSVAIESLHSAFHIDITAERQVIADRTNVLQNPGNLDLLVSMKKKMDRQDSFEICSICEAKVPFDDLMSGRCEKGHLFKRCAFTFVIITDPNSRVCGLCSREYISKRMVEEDEGKPKNSKKGWIPPAEPSFFRVLFEAVDTCVFCGGSFYDKELYRHGQVDA